MSQAHPSTELVLEATELCSFCLNGQPTSFILGEPTCEDCLDDLRAIASRPRDTLRCLPPANDVEDEP